LSSGSSDADVSVRFRAFLGRGRYADEAELAAGAVALGDRSPLKGQIEMAAPGTPPAHPEDELVPLVLGLCFHAVADLTRSDHAVVAYANDYGYLRLDREADLIRVSGDGVPLVRLPERALLPALVDCGGRFARWARGAAVPGEDPAALGRELASAEALARAALAGR
jgi:hypothetical protein